jgi:hypothetical protein
MMLSDEMGIVRVDPRAKRVADASPAPGAAA